MAIDAHTASFERIDLLWKPALLTRERVDRSTIPVGWYCCELGASFACDYGRPTVLSEHIEKNFVGMLLTPEPVPFHCGKNYRCVYGNVVGFDLYYTIEQFCRKVNLPAPIFPKSGCAQ